MYFMQETLESHYKVYGKVKEAVVLVDKKGNSKGYGFVTFDNATSALEAAKDPKKRIDNRVTHCNLAFKGMLFHSYLLIIFMLYLLCKDKYLKIIFVAKDNFRSISCIIPHLKILHILSSVPNESAGTQSLYFML